MKSKPATTTLEPDDLDLPGHRELYQRNAEWLDQHWHLVGDDCYNKFVVVSEGEIIIAINPYEAMEVLKEKHPGDVPYFTHVLSNAPPRIYTPWVKAKLVR